MKLRERDIWRLERILQIHEELSECIASNGIVREDERTPTGEE